MPIDRLDTILDVAVQNVRLHDVALAKPTKDSRRGDALRR